MTSAVAAPVAAPVAVGVLDFDPREVDPDAAVRTRRLLGRVLSSHGPAGLARALHVAAPRAAQLKHRVACVTCRSRLDGLASTLATATAGAAAATAGMDAARATPPLSPPDGPAPLTAWLAADGGRGLAPAPRALRDLGALAAFLAAFASSSAPGAAGGTIDDAADDPGRRGGRSGGVVRCPYHAPRAAVARAVAAAIAPCGAAAGPGGGGAGPAPPLGLLGGGGAGAVTVVAQRERERYVALLRSGTSDAEWRQLGAIDIDDAMCDLFVWLGDRGLCSGCVDAVTGSLLEVRRAVAGTAPCTCSRCSGRCSGSRAAGAGAAPSAAQAAPPAIAAAPAAAAATSAAGAPTARARATTTGGGSGSGAGSPAAAPRRGGPPETVRVQGRLRAICGVYRLEPLPFNGRPVFKKERTEAYLLYTSLKDWMISGRSDAGGARCEGWAYVTDAADTPDEVCGVWKVSGPRGWEEDRSLVVSAFEELPEELRAGIGYDDGSAIAKRLTANERGVLVVPLGEPEVLDEVLWEPEEPPPGRTRTGACIHVLTAEAAQRELRCWLRWLLRDRLDAQRRRVLAQAQVGASLCRLFACAALQQLEQAAETPMPGVTVVRPAREKKGQKVKKGRTPANWPPADWPPPTALDSDEANEGCPTCGGAGGGDAGIPEVVLGGLDAAGADDLCADPGDCGDGGDGSVSTGSPLTPAAPRSCAQSGDSDESASTRASSEEPPDARCARLATGARRLMEQMGWRPVAGEAALDGAEVALWREQHPRYRQVVREERMKLKTQFQQWARAALR